MKKEENRLIYDYAVTILYINSYLEDRPSKEDARKDELTKELVTKAEFLGEMKTIRLEIQALETKLEGKIKELNTKQNFLIILMIIALTLMNPVAAEIIKGLLKL